MSMFTRLLPGAQQAKNITNNRKCTKGRNFYWQNIYKKDASGRPTNKVIKRIKHELSE